MESNFSEDIFDTLLKRAFLEYANEELASYPDCETLAKKYPLPKKEKRAFDRAAKKVKYQKPLVVVYLSRVAVIFLCVIALGAGAVLASPTVRATAKSVIIDWYEGNTVINILTTDLGENDFENVEDVEIGYMTEGYVLVDTIEVPGAIDYIYMSTTDNSVRFLVGVFENDTTTMYPDADRSTYTQIEINGHEAWLIYDEKGGSGTLLIVGGKISVCVSADLPKEELIKIGENIK